MKIGLILASNIWFSPYLSIYTNILDNNKVDYTIISWNRDGRDKPIGYQYDELLEGPARFNSYRRYARFVKKVIQHEKIDRLILFGPQEAILLSDLLIRYKKKYIVDYRDLSIEQKIGFKQIYSLILKNSYANIISSPGFKKCLPKNEYLISHNFNIDIVKKTLDLEEKKDYNINNKIDILTIGGIRDYSSNIEIVKALANSSDFKCRFVGKGNASEKIESYCKENNIKNVYFQGYYPKEEEPIHIKESTFMNIFYPRIITHDTAMSNRFYNSLIYKKPMIVTKNTTQGDYAEKYKVGVVLDDCHNLKNKLLNFLETDFSEYAKNCNKLLSLFLEDEKEFVNKIEEFIS